MKVLCIAECKYDQLQLTEQKSPVVEGKAYNVIDTLVWKNEMWYSLEGISKDIWFNSKCFIPLSDIDETELVKERENVFA